MHNNFNEIRDSRFIKILILSQATFNFLLCFLNSEIFKFGITG